jgi:D-glycero-D-manno-heptose 1,7-bisphosphate phosphatase
MHPIKLVVFGRDGVLNHFRQDHVKSPDEWLPISGALDAVSRLNHAGWHAVVATNQSGIGRGMIDMASVNAVHAHMNQQLLAHGGRFDAVFYCPHTPEDQCDCRKPRPGLLHEIGRRYSADLASVVTVGDTLRDLQAAHAAGAEPHLVRSGRAAALGGDEVQAMLAAVPGSRVHASLGAFADFLLARDHVVDSRVGGLG